MEGFTDAIDLAIELVENNGGRVELLKAEIQMLRYSEKLQREALTALLEGRPSPGGVPREDYEEWARRDLESIFSLQRSIEESEEWLDELTEEE